MADTDLELPTSLKSWIAENLGQGCEEAPIRQYLLGQGFSDHQISAEIAAALNSPYFPAIKTFATLFRKRESLLKTLDFYQKFDPDHGRITGTELPPYQAFLKDYLAWNRPGLFRGAFDHWPARSWTPASLLAQVGPETSVPVQLRSPTAHPDDPHGFETQTMTFAAFVDQVENSRGNNLYMTAKNFLLDRPEFSFMRSAVGNVGDGYLNPNPMAKTMFLWMGPGGVVTQMHKDLNHILFCQIYGRKTFRMYPAIEVPYMYNHRDVFSLIDPLKPDPARYPLFEKATCFEITVEAGDMLYIPAGWWHHVSGETASISVSLTDLAGMPNHFIDYPVKLAPAGNP